MDECTNQDIEINARLTYEEENVVRYVGGYVLQALKKVTCCEDISNILNAMIEKTPLQEFLPLNSQTWATSVDRGGLTKITEEAYQLFYTIEVVVRQFSRLKRLMRWMNHSTKGSLIIF